MRIKILALLLLLSLSKISIAGNYLLVIDGETYDVSLGEELSVNVAGRPVLAEVKQKSNLVFTADSFSFEYPKQFSPSKTELAVGVSQTIMVTPLGVLAMIQEHSNIDPSYLLDLMVSEVTKEERGYGYEIVSKPASTTLSNGTKLTGKVITSKYKDSDIKRVFYTYSVKDAGLILMTQIDYEIGLDDQYVLDKFMSSLRITMK